MEESLIENVACRLEQHQSSEAEPVEATAKYDLIIVFYLPSYCFNQKTPVLHLLA